MTAGWVAGSVRARALTRRRLGVAGCRSLAAAALPGRRADPAGARRRTATTCAPRQSLAGPSTRSVPPCCGTCGCSPDGCRRDGAGALRVLAGGFEIANIDEHLRRLAGRESTATAGSRRTGWAAWRPPGRGSRRPPRWPGCARCSATSAVGRPRRRPRSTPSGMALRLAWAARVAAGVPAAAALGCRRRRPAARRGRWPPVRGSCRLTWNGAATVLLGDAADGGSHAAPSSPTALPRPLRWVLAGRRRGLARTCGGRRQPGGAGWSADGFGAAAPVRDPDPRCRARGGRGAGRRRLAGARRARAGGPRRRARWRSSMPWREALEPVRMRPGGPGRPRRSLRDAAGAGGRSGTVELDPVSGAEDGAGGGGGPAPAAARWSCSARRPLPVARAARPGPRSNGAAGPTCSPARRSSRSTSAGACTAASVAALGRVGAVGELCPRSPSGWRRSAAPSCRCRGPAGCDPPTLLRAPRRRRARSRRWSQTYATVPTPTSTRRLLAGLAYVLMFGMMFGDVGHGAAARAAPPCCLAPRPAASASARLSAPLWPFVAGARRRRMVFGAAVRRVLRPDGRRAGAVADPAGGAGAAAGGRGRASAPCCSPAPTCVGTVNRWREGGWPLALYAPSGIAGAALFLGLGAGRGSACYAGSDWLVGARGRGRRRPGCRWPSSASAPPPGAGRPASPQATVELVDMVVRLGAEPGVLRPARGVRPDPRRAGRRRLGRRPRPCGARRPAPSLAAVLRLRRRQRAWPSRWRRWSRPCRRCGWSTTSCSPGCSSTEGRPFRPWHAPRWTPTRRPRARHELPRTTP